MESKLQISISDKDTTKDTTEMNESSCEYVFGLPDCLADKILEYVGSKDMFYVVRSCKNWNTKIQKFDSFKNRKARFEFLKNKIYEAYVIWYIYGNGNAKRLSHIIDEVIEGNGEYRKVYTCHSEDALQDYLSQFVKKKKDYLSQCVKKEEGDKSRTKCPLHYKIRKCCGNIGLKSHLWHLLLLAIVSIKKSDLKFDLHENKKVDPIGYCHDLIYNYLVGDECKDLVLGLLGFNTRHVSNMFPNFMRLLYTRLTSNRILIETVMLMCFLKVAFYKNQCMVEKFLRKEDPSIQTKKDLDNWQLALIMFRELYYFWPTKGIPEYCAINRMAQYLYLTKELEDWLKRYKGDFIVFFGNTHINKFLQPVKNSLNKIQVDFSAFLPYLNKIKSFDDRYKTDKEGFWKMFFPDKLADIPISKFSHCEELCLKITPYLNRDFSEKIWDDIKLRSDIFHNLNYFKSKLGSPLRAIKNLKHDERLIINFMFDPDRQAKIDEEKLSRYFSGAIIRFFEYNEKEWEKLSDQDKDFIKSVSKIIINRREEHFFESQGELDNSNQDVPDELNQGFMFDDDNDDNDGKACDKILSDSEIKISFDISEEDKNPNKIDFINEKPDEKNDKNSEISTNHAIKTTVDNMNRRSIFDKIKDNLDYEEKPEQQEQSQESKWRC